VLSALPKTKDTSENLRRTIKNLVRTERPSPYTAPPEIEDESEDDAFSLWISDFEEESSARFGDGYLVQTAFPYVPATVDPDNTRLFYVTPVGEVYELRGNRYDYLFNKEFLRLNFVLNTEILRRVKSERIKEEIARIIGRKNPALTLILMPKNPT
jgi:hypothetical protein